MKKKVYGRKLSRDRGSRSALLRSLLRALIVNGSIVTTSAKAKFVRDEAETLLKLAMIKSVGSKRQIYAVLANDRRSAELLKRSVPVFEGVKSGFTRITKLPNRRGDNAEMVRLEWSKKATPIEKSKSKKGKKADEKVEVDKKPATQRSLKGKLSALRNRSVRSAKKSV